MQNSPIIDHAYFQDWPIEVTCYVSTSAIKPNALEQFFLQFETTSHTAVLQVMPIFLKTRSSTSSRTLYNDRLKPNLRATS